MIQKKEKKTQPITFRTTETTKDFLVEEAKQYGISVSDLVDQIIADFIKRESE